MSTIDDFKKKTAKLLLDIEEHKRKNAINPYKLLKDLAKILTITGVAVKLFSL